MSLSIRQTSDKGVGVYADAAYLRGETVLRFGGSLLTQEEVPYPLAPEDDHYLQIGPLMYLGPSGGPDDFVNHSCDPNSKVVVDDDRAWLVAIRPIAVDEEVTFDYSTTSTETPDRWTLQCRCKSTRCRGVVTGFRELPVHRQVEYIMLDAVPMYILFDRLTP